MSVEPIMPGLNEPFDDELEPDEIDPSPEQIEADAQAGLALLAKHEAKRPGKHGGWLKSGNTINRSGCVPQRIRKRLQRAALRNIRMVEAVASSPNATTDQRLKAAAMLFAYGVGTKVEVSINSKELAEIVARVSWKYIPRDEWESWAVELEDALKDYT